MVCYLRMKFLIYLCFSQCGSDYIDLAPRYIIRLIWPRPPLTSLFSSVSLHSYPSHPSLTLHSSVSFRLGRPIFHFPYGPVGRCGNHPSRDGIEPTTPHFVIESTSALTTVPPRLLFYFAFSYLLTVLSLNKNTHS